MTTEARCITEATDHREAPLHSDTAPHSGQGRVFQVFYIVDDEDQGVEVVETNRIDLEDLIPHLLLGGSVYITPKKNQNKPPNSIPP